MDSSVLDRCALCPGVNACIEPDGPEDADVIFIGEAPGKGENFHKPKPKVFVGKTGQEVDGHYLPVAGLRRHEVCFTNAIRCLPVSSGGKLDPNSAKDQRLLASCANHHLYPLLERGNHRVIVPMGAFACRALDPDIDLDIHHGFPIETHWGTLFPMFHPALGMHEPKRMLHIRTDWQRLGWYLRGRLQVPTDPFPHPDYREITEPSQLDLDPRLPLANDTESTRLRAPYCYTGSQHPGTGFLIRAGHVSVLERLQRFLIEQHTADLLWHNWLYDWAVVESMGLVFPHRRVVDTMARLFHLGNLPQGLKAFAWRELGMTMQDFDDLVTPYSSQNVLIYYKIASTFTWPKPEQRIELDSKTGLWKLKQPQSMNTKLKRFFTDYGKNEEKDVFNMWEKNWVDEQDMIEETAGPYPGKCITHVPFEEVLYYACRDADALGRAWPLIKRMKSNVRHRSQEHWREHGVTPGHRIAAV